MFMRWRIWVAGLCGIPLMLMKGFCGEYPTGDEEKLLEKHLPYELRDADNPKASVACIRSVVTAFKTGPIPWDVIGDPIKLLLNHSDCDGEIRWEDCGVLADRLQQLLNTKPTDPAAGKSAHERGTYDGMVKATERFITGLRLAHSRQENVNFH
jgi:hypothetical protein